MIAKSLILFLCSIQIWLLNCQEQCTTPLGSQGKCVDMDNCPPILAITKSSMRRNDSLFIKNSHCRNEIVNGNTILIMCCDIYSYAPGCKEPPIPKGASVNSSHTSQKIDERFPHGTKLTYDCGVNRNSDPLGGIYCQENDRWNNKVTCVDYETNIKKCLSLNSSTLSFTYIISNKNNVTIGPNNKITAKSNCLPGFVPPNGVQLPDLVCLNGQWDNTPVECVSNIATSKKLSSNTGPDQICGSEVNRNSQSDENLSAIFVKAVLNETLKNMVDESIYITPWVAGVYMMRRNEHIFKCVGTIISSKIVTSAAHCFHLDRQGIFLKQSKFEILVGTPSKTWPDHTPIGSLIEKKLVDNIIKPENYRGLINDLKDDIALVVLKTALVWTASVRPICYDFDLGVNSLELFGKVSSWSGSTSLKSMVMPLIDSKDCKNAVIIGVRSQITDDKFCGGWPEGTAMCKQDDGAAVTVVKKKDGIEKWYFQGIVTISFLDDPSCVKNKYKAFTNIYNHKDFIMSALEQYEK